MPEFVVPSDASSLALLLSAAALNGDGSVTIDVRMGALPQGDEVFIDVLESMGACIEVSDLSGKAGGDSEPSRETIRVRRDGGLKGGRFDLSNHPDLLPPLAIMALGCDGPIEIFNVGHARLKETDRISVLARELPKLGVRVDERRDGLLLDMSQPPPSRVRPPPQPSTDGLTLLNPENDHRLFMALCIAGMRVGGCAVSDPGSIAVSYPGFVDDMRRLGAGIEIV